jgi:hypothetical protein
MAGPKSGTLVRSSVLKVQRCAGKVSPSEIQRHGSRPGVSCAIRGPRVGRSYERFSAQRFARVQVLRHGSRRETTVKER